MISVISPALNERAFAKGWAEFVTQISDDIHVADCGSNDGTLDILRGYNISVQHHRIDSPYGWPEGKIRNALVDACKHEWILKLDIDELFGQDFVQALPRLMMSSKFFIRFPHLCFWLTPFTYRANAIARFNVWKFRSRVHLFRNDPLIRYENVGNHAPLSYRGTGKYMLRWLSEFVDIPNFHYHFLSPKTKQNENRGFERYKSSLLLGTYFGAHPAETQFYEWAYNRESEICGGENIRIFQIRPGRNVVVRDLQDIRYRAQ